MFATSKFVRGPARRNLTLQFRTFSAAQLARQEAWARSAGSPLHRRSTGAVVPARCHARTLSTAADKEALDVQRKLYGDETTHILEMQEIYPTFSERILPPFSTLGELMENAADKYGDNPALGVKKDGEFSYKTYNETRADTARVRAGLHSLCGIGKGDHVAIISRNRYEWVLTAYAGYGLGAVNVPMYEQQKPSDWEYIIEDSDAKVLVVATQEIYEKTKGFVGTLGHLKHIYCCDLPAEHPDSFLQLMALSEDAAPPPIALNPEELATLIYTSGTTGKPKGVMLSHNNQVSNIKGLIDHQPNDTLIVDPNDRSVAFLPWAHSYGQTCELHSGIAVGASTAIASGAPGDAVELLANIQEVKPSILFSVPTLFKKVFDGVQKKVNEATGVKRFLMERALHVGNEVRLRKAADEAVGPLLSMQHQVLDKLVLSKMRAPFGGELRVAVVAGAPTPVPVIEFMETLGIKVIEGYGLTETAPVVAITFPNPQDRVLGTVGRVIPEVDIKLMLDGKEMGPGEEGELWVSGPNVLQGYWKQPDATAEALVTCEISGKTWFRTGDLATLIDEEHLKITGRIKEQYKLENGKYVAPAPIEDAIMMSGAIAQCVLYGTGKPYNVVAIVPDYAFVAEALGIPNDPHAMCANHDVIEFIDNELTQAIEVHGIKKYEAPKRFILIEEPFSADNEMLTPKLSIRKPNVVKAYQHRLDALYEA